MTKVTVNYSYKRSTGKYFSQALILASTNPQYGKRLFIELQVQYMKIVSSKHGENMERTCCIECQNKTKKCVYNMLTPCRALPDITCSPEVQKVVKIWTVWKSDVFLSGHRPCLVRKLIFPVWLSPIPMF